MAGGASATAIHQSSTHSRALRGLLAYNGGLSKQELRCGVDTQKMYSSNPDLQQLVLGVGDSLDVQEEGLAIEMTLKEDYVANLTAACAKASGLFLPMDDEDFICDYQGIEVEVLVLNFAQCLAETPECDTEDPVKLLEEVWDSMDLECREKGEPAPPQTQKPYVSSSTPSSSSTSQAHASSSSSVTLVAGVLSALVVAGMFVYLLVQKRLKGSNDTMQYSTYEMSRQEETTLT
ncbi:MAG: hypothetical protein SGILL_010619 [Bacillariaceae sp.]